LDGSGIEFSRMDSRYSSASGAVLVNCSIAFVTEL
jgi:hypothetical protein